jgi:superfamily II RNA helicase
MNVKIYNSASDSNDYDKSIIEFPFELDNSQKNSCFCIGKNENILVTIPTGSGKTIIAEYAIAHNLKKYKKIIYTSPIKSLSNEKYKEFVDKFEKEFSEKNNIQIKVGILTGDIKINPDADVLIMTTEILRNALYRTQIKANVATELNMNFIDDVGCVIFDEIHYISDPYRGMIWEETLILLKKDIQLVMLTATVDQPEKFANWIGQLKQKPINLIISKIRTVPLKHYIYLDDYLYNIMDDNNVFNDVIYDTTVHKYHKLIKEKKLYSTGNNFEMINNLVAYLIKRNLLQTIFFSFSRLNCEKYAKMITHSLVTHDEISEITKIFNKYMSPYKKQYEHLKQYHTLYSLMMKGVAFHHSGLIPILKEIIEIIFKKKLIKILFATETFSVGINMPTRTVVFTELTKFTDGAKRFLNVAEYKQMSGRAGRRGIDTNGTIIILPMRDYPEKQTLKSIMQKGLPPLMSKFYINYQFILKIIQSDSDMYSFMKNTLHERDINDNIHFLNNKKINLENEINDVYSQFDNLSFEKYSKYYHLCNIQEQFNCNVKVKINKNKKIEINKLKSSFNSDNDFEAKYTLYKNYINLNNELDNCNKFINNLNNPYDKQSESLVCVLKNFNYITNEGTITNKGILASNMNECNELLMTEIIIDNILHDLTPEEIVSILAIFIDDVKSDNVIYKSEVLGNKKIHDTINKIKNIINKFNCFEHANKLNNEEYWKINFEYVDPVLKWATGGNIFDILKMIDIYEGNFIKNILKLNNIVQEIKLLCTIYNDIELIPQLDKIENLIIRDIVTVNSLYINNH